MSVDAFDLSGGALVAVIVLVVVELVLVVISLVDLVRRPAVLGGRKWVWVLVILVFNMIGPILYLAVGRAAPPAPEPAAPAATADRAAAAADLLYGPRDGAGDGRS